MNILFFNRSFYPDIEATGQFLTELCEDLAELGHEITVVSGKSYHVSSKNKFFLKEKPDVIVAQTDPPVLGLLGIFFSKWYKAKFVYYCKDIYPDVGIITGKLRNPLLNWLLKSINDVSYSCATRIVCIGEDMKKRIIEKGVEGNKISVIHDWANTKELNPVPDRENLFKTKFRLPEQFTVMYSGNLGLTQDLEKVIEVAKHFKDQKELRFIFIGEGANKTNLQNLATKYNLVKVHFLPYQPKEELKYSLSAADIHLITFQKGLAGVMVPSKVYGILACGKPFIGWIDEESEVYNIAHRFNCGLTVPPGDINKMVETLNWAINHRDKLQEMGESARKAAEEFFDRKISITKFNKLILDVSANLN